MWNASKLSVGRRVQATAPMRQLPSFKWLLIEAQRKMGRPAASVRSKSARSRRIQLGFTRFRDSFQDDLPEGPFDIGAIITGTPGARGSAGVRLVRFLSSADLTTSSFTVPSGARLVRRSVRLSASQPSKTITERRTAEYQGNWNYSSRNGLAFGYDFEQERGITDIAPPLRNNHGVFASHQHSIAES